MNIMWPVKRVKQRRLGVRRTIKADEVNLWQQIQRDRALVPLLLAGVLLLGVAVMDLTPLEPFTYNLGQFVPADIYARVPFRTYPQRLLEKERSEIERYTPAVFALNQEFLGQIQQRLLNAPDLLAPLEPDVEPSETQVRTADLFGVTTQAQREAWAAMASGEAREDYDARIQLLIDDLAVQFLVDTINQPELSRSIDRTSEASETAVVFVAFPNTEELASLPFGPEWIPIGSTERVAAAVDDISSLIEASIQADVRHYLNRVLRSQALYVYDEAATQEVINEEIDWINANPPSEEYAAGTRLVTKTLSQTEDAAGRGLTDGDLQVLRAEHEAYLAYELREQPLRLWGRFIGRSTILAALVMLMSIYVYIYRRRIVTNPWRALALVMLFLGMLAVNKLMFSYNMQPTTSVLPVMMAAVILTIAYDQRLALALSTMLVIMIVLQMRATFDTFLVVSAASTCTVVLLGEIRTRSKVIEVAALAAVVVFVMACSLGMAVGVPWPIALANALWGSGFAILAGLLIQGLLPIIERAFNIATSMTLLEWCDASKPLLRRLAMSAPGTYNHSLHLGTMCETAAEAIGARGLRARVGAYYHDIGKINKPDYFVENNPEASKKHEKLSPEMSLLIILGHVKDGIEMAREYNLPTVLHEFINTHHGTTVMRYFYHAATQQQREHEAMPDEDQFRYPGPKPQSREAAILMLADGAESSVRAMTDPTTKQIENQVHQIVSARLADGQLDECDLTLKEVHAIEQSLVKSLLGFYHARIAYPKVDEDEPAPQPTSAAPIT
jgi:putative nucleotidyltransferase with HDIG domain